MKVIFDTDPGVDDALALLYLACHPAVELLGITTVFGNASAETTTRNALFLCERWRIDAPVHPGAGRPFAPERPDETDWPTLIHGRNGLGDIDLGEPHGREAEALPAHRFIVDTLRANPGEVTILAVGRMTNLALALREAPEIAELARGVVIMGGAFLEPGNVTPAAEANIFGDPEAADLDVTRQTVMTSEALKDIAREGGADAELLRELSLGYVRFYSAQVIDGMVVHDAAACVRLTDPDLFRTVTGAVRVAGEGVALGATILKPDSIPFPPGAWDGRPSQTVCVGVDADAVLRRIRDTIVAGQAHRAGAGETRTGVGSVLSRADPLS